MFLKVNKYNRKKETEFGIHSSMCYGSGWFSGKGGSKIRELQDESGARIDVSRTFELKLSTLCTWCTSSYIFFQQDKMIEVNRYPFIRV